MNIHENIGTKPEKGKEIERNNFIRGLKRTCKIFALVAPLMLASMEGKAGADTGQPNIDKNYPGTSLSMDHSKIQSRIQDPFHGKTLTGGESHIKSHTESHIKPFQTKTLTGGAEQSNIVQPKNNLKENTPSVSVNGSSETVYEDGNVKVIGDKDTKFKQDDHGNTQMSGGIIFYKNKK